MLRKVCEKKVVALFLCSWFVATPVFAFEIPRNVMDVISCIANIAKISDTIHRLFGSDKSNNQSQQCNVIEIIEEEHIKTQYPNGTVVQCDRNRHYTYTYPKKPY